MEMNTIVDGLVLFVLGAVILVLLVVGAILLALLMLGSFLRVLLVRGRPETRREPQRIQDLKNNL